MNAAGPAARLHWWSTVLYVPALYGLGWVASRPLLVLAPTWRADQMDLVGLVISMVLLLSTLPRRLERLWGVSQPWRQLGVSASAAPLIVRALLRGLLKALLLLLPLTLLLLLSDQARWLGDLNQATLLNAVALVLGVGFAEELLFRGWLWGELERLIQPQRALLAQAGLFALVHPWFRLPGLQALALLGGLVLLGLVLALQRRADGGLLWGAVGLHGGLVGGWFALQNGLLELAPAAPSWLIGPGGSTPNPIGGVAGLVGLGVLLWVRKRWLEASMTVPDSGGGQKA
jgi:membrane protease YdiL (CAAX protease family)